MQELQILLKVRKHSEHIPCIMYDFFVCFSRFEFALKRAGFLCGDGKECKANWVKFADQLDNEFFESVESTLDARYIIDHPPLKQIVSKDQISWKKVASPDSGKEVLGAVRRVRNNLFHGAKYQCMPVEDPARDEKLIRACIIILDLALKGSPKVSEIFEQT